MTIIFARKASVPIDIITDELSRLNEALPHAEWIDMVAVSDTARRVLCLSTGRPIIVGRHPAAVTRGKEFLFATLVYHSGDACEQGRHF